MALKDVREARNLSQRALAELSGVEAQTISDIERNVNKNPSWDKVAKLAHALGCDPQDVCTVELPPHQPPAEVTP